MKYTTNTLRSVSALLIIFVCFSAIGCGPKAQNSHLKIGYLPIAECLPLYIAKEKGFFEKYGLEVELISISGGPTVFKELNANSIDIGFSNVVTLIQYNNAGENFKSVFGGTYETKENINHAIYKRKGYKDSLMTVSNFGLNAQNNIEELMLINYLEHKGINVTDSVRQKFQAIPFPQMLSSLREGTIDYACLVEPFISLARRDSQAFEYVGNHYTALKENKILVATYVASELMISKNKKQIEAFIKAMTEATEYIKNNEEECRIQLLKYSKITEAIVKEIGLPQFEVAISPDQLDIIIKLMYALKEKNSSFIKNPDKQVKADEMIFSNE
jgi:NitT/TauT family transport system substrate-binding protein